MPYSPMQLAEAFIKTGELTDALDALNQQLENQPEDHEARRLRIDVLLRLYTVEHSQQALDDLSALSEQTADDYQRQAVLYERLGAPDKAIAAIQKARQLNPESERLTEYLLNVLIQHGKFDTALELVREQEKSWRWLQYEGDVLVHIGDDTLATARYGLVLSHLDDLEGVLREDYRQAIKARVLLARAHAYRRLGHIDIAREHYQSAQALLPKDPTIRFNLGLLDALSGNLENAISECKAALENAPNSLREEMFNSLKNDENFHEILKILRMQ